MRSTEDMLGITRDKATAIRRRRARHLGLAAVVMLVCGVLSIVLIDRGNDHHDVRTIATTTSTTSTTSPAASTTTTPPTTATTTTEPTASTSEPIPSTDAPPSIETVAATFPDGANGLQADASFVGTDAPGVGDLTIHIVDPAGRFDHLRVGWGDGTQGPSRQIIDCIGEHGDPTPTDLVLTNRHSYAAGTYMISIEVGTDGCGDGEFTTGSLTITSTESAATLGADDLIDLDLQRVSPEDSFLTPFTYDPSKIQVDAGAYSADANVTRVEVDWGDGSPIESQDRGAPCGSQDASLLYGPWEHAYAEPGAHRVTVTAYSVPCDGDGPAGRASAGLAVMWPTGG